MLKLSNKIWQDPSYFIAFGFGSGLMPLAPGTWGTLAAIPIYLLIAKLPWSIYLVITFLAFGLGVVVCNKVSRELGVHDYSGIVWDEIVGYLLTLFLAPLNFYCMILGFLLFRLFDVWKPWPIRMADNRIHGGFGIMFDDVLAAVPAWVLLQLAILLYHGVL